MLKKFYRYKKTILWMIFILSITMGIGYKQFITVDQIIPQSEKIVEVQIAKHASIQKTVEVIGTIRANKKTTLTAKATGVLAVFVQPGQFIKKGTLLAKVENKEKEQNVNLQQELAEIAKLQFERAVTLLKSGVYSKTNVEEKKTIFLDLQKKLSDAKIAVAELTLYAPFDGRVGVFKLREGSEVAAGEVVVDFYDPRLLLVEFDLPLSTAKQVNDLALIFVNQQPYRLTHVQKMLDEATHMCPAYAEIDCADCIIGTTVDVSIVVTKKDNVMVVPLEAVFLKGGKSFMYVIKSNKAILTAVELGIQDKKQVEITSGLKEGDQLIVHGHHRLYPDALVSIAK